MKLLAEWRQFCAEVEKRLEAGEREYGDLSLRRLFPELMGEVEQEMFDVVGWSFLAWLRVRAMKERVK